MHNNTIIREQVDRLGRPAVAMLNREIARLERHESYKKLLRGILVSIAAAAAIIILVTNLWAPVLQIGGSSMNPLLQMNEIVLAINNDNPAKNDVIAFYHQNKLHVKRVIATAGDSVSIDDYGIVSVNNSVLDEPYVSELSLGICDIEIPFWVPAGAVFVLGDNRPVSMDSRSSAFGPINRDQIIGKVIFSIWPLPRFGGVK